jgi:uncharacterized protein (DUF1810 family)
MDNDNLQRFVEAQNKVYNRVVSELKSASKQSHWMWFIFPQLSGLGRSAVAERYAIQSLAEARDYLQHPILGARYMECIGILLAIENRSAEQIFGYPDVLKLHSSVTLFQEAEPRKEFAALLEKYYGGEADGKTLQLLHPTNS